jgi:hypothetical protein
MTFGELEENTVDANGNALMNENTPPLRAASVNLDSIYTEPEKVKMTEHMTNGKSLQDSSAKSGLGSVTAVTPDHNDATLKLHETMEHITSTSAISKIRNELKKNDDEQYTKNSKTLRATICSLLHDTPSVPHLPQRSIKVTTLQNSSPPWLRRFQHRLPLLLRLLLSPVSYFHPISLASITGTASGQWIRHVVLDYMFKGYSESNQDIRNLEGRMSAWLADANPALEMDEIVGQTQVPVITDYDINCFLGVKDVLIYRTLPKKVLLKEIVQLGGADATFTISTFLLPHHEHIIPPKPSSEDKQDIKGSIESADGKPQQFLAEKELDQAEKDEANVQISVHAKLPACLDQELLNFVAAIVKATKLVEMEKELDITDFSPVKTDAESTASVASDSSEPNSAKIDTKSFHGFAKSLNTKTKDGFKSFNTATRDGFKNLNTVTKEGLKKAVIGGIVNDR